MFLRWEKRKGTSELLPTRRFERPIERRWSQFNEIINSRRQLKLDRRRRDDTEQTRRISDTNKETDAIADDDNQQVNTKIERQRKNKANRKSRRPRLMTYDSLISVNDAVFSGDINWVLKPRPDGKRALLSITIMGIIVIDRDGRQLWSCSHEHVTRENAALSYIPVGTCLDGIWSTGDCKVPTFFILDILRWNDRIVEGCEFQMREFFLRSRLEETGLVDTENWNHGTTDDLMAGNLSGSLEGICSVCFIRGMEFAPSQAAEYCAFLKRFLSSATQSIGQQNETITRIQEFHLAPSNASRVVIPFQLDGVIFFHPEADYISGATPFVVHWRPAELSQWSGVEHRSNSFVTLLVDRSEKESIKRPRLVTSDGIQCQLMDADAAGDASNRLPKDEEHFVQIRGHTVVLKNDQEVFILTGEVKPTQSSAGADLLSKLIMTAHKVYQEDSTESLIQLICNVPSLQEAMVATAMTDCALV